MKKVILYMSVVMLFISACDRKEDFEQINSSTVAVSGEWWVQYSTDGYESGFYKLHTYNTAKDDGTQIWIEDVDEWWIYKVKCPVNVSALTFSGVDMISEAYYDGDLYDISINITNGKIMNDISLQPSGVLADSIYFEIEFEDDPGTIYIASGFRKTGFLEDEH